MKKYIPQITLIALTAVMALGVVACKPSTETKVRAKGNQLEGEIKQAAGEVTGNQQLQTEGQIEEAKGDAQDAAADVQEKVE
jgi:uncharacterized protein YjbJ (UPF0337 family)